MPSDLQQIFEAKKTLATNPQWVELDSQAIEVVCPLEIDGVVVEGLLFRATARKGLPDELVTAQVEYHPSAEPGGPLARIEWRPITSQLWSMP